MKMNNMQKGFTLSLSVVFLGLLLLTSHNTLKEFEDKISLNIQDNLTVGKINYKLESIMHTHERLNKKIRSRYWEIQDDNVIIYDQLRDKESKDLFGQEVDRAIFFHLLYGQDLNFISNHESKNVDLLRILPYDINYDYVYPAQKQSKIYNKIFVVPKSVNFKGYDVDLNLVDANFVSVINGGPPTCSSGCPASIYLNLRVYDLNGGLAFENAGRTVYVTTPYSYTITIDTNSPKTNDIIVTVSGVGSTGVLSIENTEKNYMFKTKIVMDMLNPTEQTKVSYDENMFIVSSNDFVGKNS